MKKLLALLLALALAVPMTGISLAEEAEGEAELELAPLTGEAGKYTYRTSVSQMPTGWNPHTYQTQDDSVPLDWTISSLYSMIFNDANNPVEGKDPFTGYVVVPEMAADYPVDVTEEVKASHPQFGIPASATSGYAWKVTLRDDLKWEDGTPIKAVDFVESLKRLLDPEKLNYRAADTYNGSYALANAINYALAGNAAYTSFAEMGTTYADYIANGGADENVAVDMNGFWSVAGPDGIHGWGYITDDTMVRDPAVEEGKDEDYVSAKYLWENYLGPNGQYAGTGYDTAYAGVVDYPYEAGYSFDNVGLFASGENELTFVFKNALDGFYLMMYGMNTPYLVKTDLYDECLKETKTASGSAWSSTYGTSLETWSSYGPYKFSDFQPDKSMHFVKNENWYGWNDGKHVYVDPQDGETYPMYQTTDIDYQYIKESSTRRQMFLAGQQAGYGLQGDDFDQYRNSEYYYATPAETIYFLLFNGYESVIKEREAAADFDAATTDLQVQMLENFRRACAVSIDRELMAATLSPSRTGGYAFLGNTYVYDPETAAYYRDTKQAKEALVDFYSINLDNYNGDLDAATAAITGYDPVVAAELFQKAYEEALEKGYITDADNDGKSDQTVTMVYAMSSEVNSFLEKTMAFLNDSLNKGAKGTGLEGKIAIVPSAPVGNAWSDNLRNGIMDTQLAGWSGSTLDPFGMADTWTDPDKAYWGKWYDANKYDMTLTLDGKELTMSVRDWALCLNGTMKTVDGVSYNFGYGQTSVDNRLTILAAIERHMLTAYNCVPIMQDGSGALLSQQMFYVVEDYVPMLGRGGIQYIKYNYDDAEWATFVAEQGGILKY